MGCDIHIVLEKNYNGRWIGLREIDSFAYWKWSKSGEPKRDYLWHPVRARNYERFAKMAGVRGEGPDARGTPDDASELTKMLFENWGVDGHSHSWLPLPDAAEIFLATEYDPGTVFLTDGDPRKKDPYEYYFQLDLYENDSPSDYRIVFCFDN